MPSSIDLTPFGFTPTESLAYEALLALGPASGYAVAKHLSVARANAYQALNGLVAKGAAVLIEGSPQRFRAVRPDAVLARITAVWAERLAALDAQVREVGPSGGEAIIAIRGERALLALLTRTAGREPGEVRCVAPTRIRNALQPVWRKREAGAAVTHLWAPEDAPGIEAAFPDATVLFWCPTAAIIATVAPSVSGYWCSDPVLTAAVHLAINQLIG